MQFYHLSQEDNFLKMLSDLELKYYSRQILLEDIGLAGQEKLKKAKVLVIGAGGLGCPVLTYLTAAGVGNIGIVDHDIIEISNLHRQTLYSFEEIGKSKAEIAKIKLEKLNPFISIEVFSIRFEIDNALKIMEKYEIIVDCSDNYETRFLVNDATVFLNKILIYGSIYKFEGQVSVFNFKNGPTYRCLFPEMPVKESLTNCSLSGVIGVLPGIIGGFQANEVVKIITEQNNILSGKLMIYNAKTNHNQFIDFKRNSAINYDLLFKLQLSTKIQHYEISKQELLEVEKIIKQEILFLDVREIGEIPIFETENLIRISLSKIELDFNKIPKNQKVIVFCQSGIRSKNAINLLKKLDNFENLINLNEGISEEFIESWKEKK